MATHRLGGSSKRKSKREGLTSFFKGQNLSKVRQLNLSSRQEVERGVGGDTRNLSVRGVQ